MKNKPKSKGRKKLRQVSKLPTYISDFKDHESRTEVVDEVEKVTNYFKNLNDSQLVSDYNDHGLTGTYQGFRSLALYPGESGDRDIVIVYKNHRNEHIVFHHIGNHEYVYGKK